MSWPDVADPCHSTERSSYPALKNYETRKSIPPGKFGSPLIDLNLDFLKWVVFNLSKYKVTNKVLREIQIASEAIIPSFCLGIF